MLNPIQLLVLSQLALRATEFRAFALIVIWIAITLFVRIGLIKALGAHFDFGFANVFLWLSFAAVYVDKRERQLVWCGPIWLGHPFNLTR